MAQNIVALVDLLASTVGGDIKVNKAAITDAVNKRGDMATLNTGHKATLVGALNELKTGLDNIDLSEIINDGDVTATNSALSASKVSSLIQTAKDEILGGAGSAFDTLKELQDALQSNPDVVTSIQTALAKRVRVDAVQDFTVAEKLQGRQNINAADATELDTLEAGVGAYGTADFVATYVGARDAA